MDGPAAPGGLLLRRVSRDGPGRRHGLQCYADTDASFVASFFPEIPTVTALDDRTFTLDTERPLPTLDALMSNILITPAAANRPEELQDGLGSGPSS